MKKKIFYIIRHGQTDLNLKGIVQGRGINSPLNDHGVQQAKAFFNAYQHIPFDKIYTSTLLRTEQTVQQFINKGIPNEPLVGLDEISWGVYEGQDLNDSILKGFDELVTSWRNGELDHALEQGESPNQVALRQQEAFKYMLQQDKEETVLVCMHGRALRILLCHLTGIPISKMDDFSHTNTSLYVVEYQDGMYRIIDAFNTRHLEDLQCTK